MRPTGYLKTRVSIYKSMPTLENCRDTVLVPKYVYYFFIKMHFRNTTKNLAKFSTKNSETFCNISEDRTLQLF